MSSFGLHRACRRRSRRSSLTSCCTRSTRSATVKKTRLPPPMIAATPRLTARCVLLHPLKCPPRNETVCVSYHSGEKRRLPYEDALQGRDHCESSRHDSWGGAGYPAPKTVPGECVNRANCHLLPIRALNREWSNTH